MAKIIKYSRKQFDLDIDSIVAKILKSKIKFDFIVALSRGGLIPGVVLSHKLGLRLEPIVWTSDPSTRESNEWIPLDIQMGAKILIVDDIVDSGRSIGDLLNDWEGYCSSPDHPLKRENIFIASLIYNKDQSIVANYFGTKISRKKTPEWFEFWWEKQ